MLALLISAFAFAQATDSPTAPDTVYAKETIVDFVGSHVEGTVEKPQLVLINEWKPHHEGSLIRLRTSFQIEMIQSVEEVK